MRVTTISADHVRADASSLSWIDSMGGGTMYFGGLPRLNYQHEREHIKEVCCPCLCARPSCRLTERLERSLCETSRRERG